MSSHAGSIRRTLVAALGAATLATCAVGVSADHHQAARKHNPFVVALNSQPLPPGRHHPAARATTLVASQVPPDPCRGCVHAALASVEVIEHRSGGDPSTAHKSPGRNKFA
jgi:hypothetical protein